MQGRALTLSGSAWHQAKTEPLLLVIIMHIPGPTRQESTTTKRCLCHLLLVCRFFGSSWRLLSKMPLDEQQPWQCTRDYCRWHSPINAARNNATPAPSFCLNVVAKSLLAIPAACARVHTISKDSKTTPQEHEQVQCECARSIQLIDIKPMQATHIPRKSVEWPKSVAVAQRVNAGGPMQFTFQG